MFTSKIEETIKQLNEKKSYFVELKPKKEEEEKKKINAEEGENENTETVLFFFNINFKKYYRRI